MVNKLNKNFYNTVLCQAFSPCGNYLAVGDIYGVVSIFHLSRVVQADNESAITKEQLLPKYQIEVKKDYQINSLLTAKAHLLIGSVGTIYAYAWKSIRSSKNVTVAWSIDIPNKRDTFERTEVNCLLYNEETDHIYAACDKNIYVFDLESRMTAKVLENHTDYLHSLHINGNDLISGGEDGIVNLWDLRSYKISNKIEPYKDEKLVRTEPHLGKWIGAVGGNEDYILCGGGPRLSLWHYRFLSNFTMFPIEDTGIHVAEIYQDRILAGGRSKFFYQMTFSAEVISEIPTTAVTTYSAAHQDEPFKVLTLAGSSGKIDVCNFMYKNQQLSLY
nr:unnamed protein product [Callosobruchus analis]